MNGPRRFSAAPVNFNRFVVLARSYPRSMSPDKELHQLLRPFEDRTVAVAENRKRQSSTGRVATSQLPHEEMVHSELVDKEVAPTQVLSSETYSGAVSAITTTRCAKVEEELCSTRAATSTSRSVSGGAAAPSSVISNGSSYSVQGGYPVGEETQDLGPSFYSADEVDPLLQATLQLGSPLYDPVKRQFVCWNLHTLQDRPRAAYGDIEGVSCDFCGYTDWLEVGDGHATSCSSAIPDRVALGEGGADATTPSAAASFSPQARFFHHCSICQVDICQMCVQEVFTDERFHVPCLQCQRCGGFEQRQNAPLHRCAELGALEYSKVHDNADKIERLSSVSDSDACLPETLPSAPTLLPGKMVRVSSMSKCAGVPVGRPLRLGLSRFHRQAPKEEPVSDAEVHGNAERAAGTGIHRKRRRASPEAFSAPKRHAKDELKGCVKTSSLSDVSNSTNGESQRVSASAGPKPLQTTQKDESDSEDDSSRAAVGAIALPYPRYEVHLIPRTAEDVQEVSRIAKEQHLICSSAPSMSRASVFSFATRLAAEMCIDRATAASLESVLRRNLRPVCGG